MSKSIFYLALSLCILVLNPLYTWAQENLKPGENLRRLPLSNTNWSGDFDGMLERRVVRLAVPYSRTFYYIDKGHEQGLAAGLIRDFELYLNTKHKKQLKRRPITVYAVPVTRDKMLDALSSGKVDIAVGNLTITEKRLEQVDFVPLTVSDINEIVVSHEDVAMPATTDGLAGQTIHVRPSSSYYESLLALNERLVQQGKQPIELELLPDALEDEDLLEMVNVGIIPMVIMDNWKAQVWSHMLPGIKLHQHLVLRADSRIGWAIRKQSEGLRREIEYFFKNSRHRQVTTQRYQQLTKKVKRLRNNVEDREIKKFEQILALFEKYGQRYRFDPLLLAAQGYQESRLNQSAVSHVGAIGIMQIMPGTGNALKVGNIRITEPNIHAGAKYLDLLLQRYFPDAAFTELDRSLFAFAAYNAGPGNIAKMRREAAKRGLDSNRWFNNVEMVTAERIGSETTTYVRNVFKYYAAYKLVQERRKEQQKARRQIGSQP